MSGITIEAIARGIQQASMKAKQTGRIWYVHSDGVSLDASAIYDRGYVAKCYPGGRVELRGPIGERVREWQKSQNR